MTVRTPVFSWRRVWAMMLRHLYLLRSSWPRLLDLVYWPVVQMIVWGFISQFFSTHSSWVAQAAGVLLGAVLLWDVMFRGNISLSLSFLEEMWSRNLGHLAVSPLRPIELVVALIAMSLIRTLLGVAPAALLAIPLYHYSIFDMGLPLLSFFANLMMTGWFIAFIVSAMVLRFGLGAESMAWALIFGLSPISGIYYPIDVLPPWLQTVAWCLPPAYVFEGMRGVMFDHLFRWDLFFGALGLNVLCLGGAVGLFLFTFHVARKRGLLLGMGE
ncbi:MAG: ABC transporter permease [Rhodospirillales bacterium]|nr:ABC transporter permease [Rhodospirillales bacterium]